MLHDLHRAIVMAGPREDWAGARHRPGSGAVALLLTVGLTAASCGRLQRLMMPPEAQRYYALTECVAHIDSLPAYSVEIRTSFPRSTTYVVTRSHHLVTVATGSGQTARREQFDPAGARERVEAHGRWGPWAGTSVSAWQLLARGGYLGPNSGTGAPLLLSGLVLGGVTPEAMLDLDSAGDSGESWVDGHQVTIVKGAPGMRSAELLVGTRSAARVASLTFWIGLKNHLLYVVRARLLPAPGSPDTLTERLTWKATTP
ncbi:MAG: hypothetical protein KGJ62_12950 [Armatimonadetes bacterium]|nr:hypothetical protein [Armatimonadota bacterium]MDE2208017.1 hypothetical protein [Armatimonadota bacterium]